MFLKPKKQITHGENLQRDEAQLALKSSAENMAQSNMHFLNTGGRGRAGDFDSYIT